METIVGSRNELKKEAHGAVSPVSEEERPLVPTTVASRIDDLVREFEVRNSCLNRSPKTISWYSNNLRLFVEFLKRNGYSLSIRDITAGEVKEFILYLRQKNRYDGHPLTPTQAGKLSPQTIRAHVETLKAFFAWLHREGHVESNTLEHLEFPKVPRKLKEVLTKEEVERLLASFDRSAPLGRRNSTILMMLLDTGLRCAELTNLKLNDVHVDRGYVKVMGKGARERIVPIGFSLQRTLAEYIRDFCLEPADPKIDNVFLSKAGKPMATDSVQSMLKRRGRRCGVPRLHTHLCRHTFATNYLINGGDLFTLQSILGHSSLEMVRRYVSLASGFVVMQHHRFSPLDMMHSGMSRGERRVTLAQPFSRSRSQRAGDSPSQGNAIHDSPEGGERQVTSTSRSGCQGS